MSDKSNSDNGELTISGNRSLVKRESSLVLRGLKLIDEIDKPSSGDDLKNQMESIANTAMTILINERVPYKEEIVLILKDIEHHYQRDDYSSIEDFNVMQFDIKVMCSSLRLSYEIGNRIFHFWARTFHKSDNKELFDKDAKDAGIPLTSDKIVCDLKKLIEEHDFKYRPI